MQEEVVETDMHLFNDYDEITKFLTSGGKVDIRFKRR